MCLILLNMKLEVFSQRGNDSHVRGLERKAILDLTKEIEKVIARIKVIKLESLNIADIMELALTAGLTFYEP